MMRIGLLSDTHGYLDPKVLEYFAECDEIWHAGDMGSLAVMDELAEHKPVRGVYGNIDGTKIRTVYPLDLRFTVEGVAVWMTHIGGYPGRYDKRVREILQNGPPPKLFICGHSHILKVMRDPKYNNMLTMNPGAAGVHGFHKVKTTLRFTLDAGTIKDLEVIELGKRATTF